MRILVTGSNGVFGSAIAARLCETRPEAVVLGIDRSPLVGIAGEVCDLADPAATSAAIVRLAPDFVFHCAGGVTGPDVEALFACLVTPTQVLVDVLAQDAPASVLVVPGSAAEYGSLPAGRTAFSEDDDPAPVSPYGIAKAAQTKVALDAADAGLDTRVGRVFNLIGPGIPPTFLVGRVSAQLAAIAAGTSAPRLDLGPLSGVRDFIDVRDACDGLLAVAERGRSGRIYNVCSGVGHTVREAVDTLVRCSGLEVRIAEESHGSPRTGLDVSVGDPSRIAAELGWRVAIGFEQSACDAVAAARTVRYDSSRVPPAGESDGRTSG